MFEFNSCKIAILGGAGFVGSNLVSKLSKNPINQNQILVIDKLVHPYSKTLVREFPTHVKLQEQDINNSEILVELLEDYKIDTIIHLAANSDIKAGLESDSITSDITDTLGSTLALAEATKKRKNINVIFASTSAIYGDIEDSAYDFYHELNLLKPISKYGIAKLSSEYILREIFNEKLISKLTILRFPNVVGKNSTHGILFDFMEKFKNQESTLNVLGDGTQLKPYILVDQLVEVIYNQILETDKGRQIKYLNISPPDQVSVAAIVDIFLKLTRWSPKVSYGDTPHGWIGDVPAYSFKPNDYTKTLMSSSEAVEHAISDLLLESRFRH